MRYDDNDEGAYDEDPHVPGDNDDEDESHFETEAEVSCPFCGEVVVIAIDPNGGSTQEYVEDCEVCCRPWSVHVAYDDEGHAEVTVGQG